MHGDMSVPEQGFLVTGWRSNLYAGRIGANRECRGHVEWDASRREEDRLRRTGRGQLERLGLAVAECAGKRGIHKRPGGVSGGLACTDFVTAG